MQTLQSEVHTKCIDFMPEFIICVYVLSMPICFFVLPSNATCQSTYPSAWLSLSRCYTIADLQIELVL